MANTGIQGLNGTQNPMLSQNIAKQENDVDEAVGFGRVLDRSIEERTIKNQRHVRKTENQTVFQTAGTKDNSKNTIVADIKKETVNITKQIALVKQLSGTRNASFEALSEMCSNLKTKLADLMDVSEEELEEAMETLGLTMMDLFQTNNLQTLFLEVNQVEDMSALLTDETLSTDFQTLCQMISENAEDFEQLGLTPEEAKSLMSNFEADMDEALSKDEIPSTENITKEPVHSDEKAEVEEEASSDSKGFTQDKTQKHETKEIHVVVNGNNVTATEIKESFMDQLAPTSQSKEIVNQIVNEIKVTISKTQTSMEMVLTPDALGKVNLTVAHKDGVMTAHLITETNTAKHAIESQIMELKETLNEQGLKVEAVEVTVAANNFDFMKESHEEAEKQEDHSIIKNGSKKLRMMGDESEESAEDVVEEKHEESEILASVGKGMQMNYSA